MLKRQESRLSSSRRQTPEPEKQGHAKTVGCMSGIFQLISKYQNPHKLLTFGKKVERKAVLITSPTKKGNIVMVVKDEEKACGISPMLSPKLRTRPDKVPENEPEKVEEEEETSEEKRQRLLEALEKCNEDLEALKMIIMSVQPNDRKPVQSHRLGTIASSFTTNSKFIATAEGESRRRPKTKTRPEKDKGIGARRYSKFVREPFRLMHRKPISRSIWGSKAMVRSVEEVCNDIFWGEKREVANIAVTLHNYICKDLIEETIKELGCQKLFLLPLRHGCKRRLSF